MEHIIAYDVTIVNCANVDQYQKSRVDIIQGSKKPQFKFMVNACILSQVPDPAKQQGLTITLATANTEAEASAVMRRVTKFLDTRGNDVSQMLDLSKPLGLSTCLKGSLSHSLSTRLMVWIYQFRRSIEGTRRVREAGSVKLETVLRLKGQEAYG